MRQARAARSARAGEATAIARGERAPTPAAVEAPTSDGAEKATSKRSGRPRRQSPYTVPGQRAVVLAFLFTIVAAGSLVLSPVQVARDVPEDDPRVEEDDERNDDGTVTIVEDGKLFEEETVPVALVVTLAPVAITGAALWFTKRPRRSTAWSIAMVAMAAYVFFVGPYGLISLPALVALGVAGFQSRRVESKERLAVLRAQRAARTAGADGEVIDAEAVEEPVDDDATRS